MIYVIVLNCEDGICHVYPFPSHEEATDFANNDPLMENHDWMVTEEIKFT